MYFRITCGVCCYWLCGLLVIMRLIHDSLGQCYYPGFYSLSEVEHYANDQHVAILSVFFNNYVFSWISIIMYELLYGNDNTLTIDGGDLKYVT